MAKSKHFPKPIFYFLIFNFIITFKLFFTSSKAYNNFFLNTEPAYPFTQQAHVWAGNFLSKLRSNQIRLTLFLNETKTPLSSCKYSLACPHCSVSYITDVVSYTMIWLQIHLLP